MVKRSGAHPGIKALAVVLYSLGRMSYEMIGYVFGVSGVAVYKWVKAAGERLPEPRIPVGLDDIQMDEMHHFLVSKKRNAGSGKPMRLIWIEPSPGSWVAVIAPRATSSGTRSKTPPRNTRRMTIPSTVS